MRLAVFTLIGGILIAAPAAASPAVFPPPAERAAILQVWGGCGWGFHPNRWGYCVPNRYGYYRPAPPPDWRGYHGYYGEHPYWRGRPGYGY